MKRFPVLVSLLLALCVLVTGCAGRGAESSSSLETPPPSSSEAPDSENARYEEMLITYGAIRTEDGVLRPQKGASLYYGEDWDEEHPLPPNSYMAWNLNRMWAATPTLEEREARYTPPDNGGGWFFPEEEYERETQTYFSVSTDTLRLSDCYEPQNHGYRTPPGGMGITPTLHLHRAEEEDGRLRLHLTLVYDPAGRVNGDQPAALYKILTVEVSDSGYRFVSYQTDPDPSAEQQAAAFTPLSSTPTQVGSAYTDQGLGYTLTLPQAFAGHYLPLAVSQSYGEEDEVAGYSVSFVYMGDPSLPLFRLNLLPTEQAGKVPVEGTELFRGESWIFYLQNTTGANPFPQGPDRVLYEELSGLLQTPRENFTISFS